MARPSKYNADIHERICNALRAGNTQRVSCQSVGIDPSTFGDWVRTKPEFAEAVTQAMAEAEAKHVKVLMVAAESGDWRASESWLKRRNRADWGDNVSLDLDERISKLLAELAGSGQAQAPGEAGS